MSRTLVLISSARSESAEAALPLDTVLARFASPWGGREADTARAPLTVLPGSLLRPLRVRRSRGGLPALLLARRPAPGRARPSRLLPRPWPGSGSAPRRRAAGRGSRRGHGLARPGVRQVGVGRGLLV